MASVTSVLLGPGAELRLTFDDIAAEAGPGAHRLALRYQATPIGLPPGSVAMISGALRLQHSMQWLGMLQVEQPLPISRTASYPRSIVLVTTISHGQLAGIETARDGADLQLVVDI